MPVTQKIHIISDDDEIVILMNLLGIQGTILEGTNKFIDIFDNLTKDKSIGIIIISVTLSDKIIDYLIEFKLNNIKPFIFLIPNLFEEQAKDKSIFLNKVYKQAEKLLI